MSYEQKYELKTNIGLNICREKQQNKKFFQFLQYDAKRECSFTNTSIKNMNSKWSAEVSHVTHLY